MAGTVSLRMSRPDGLDFCFIVNARNFRGEDVIAQTNKAINTALDAAEPACRTQLRHGLIAICQLKPQRSIREGAYESEAFARDRRTRGNTGPGAGATGPAGA